MRYFVSENTLVTRLRLVTHRLRGSASQEPAESARPCVPRPEPGNESTLQPWGRFVTCLCAAACLGVCTWATAIPPLSLDGYRDEKLMEGPHASAGLKEINGGCYVCHGNYRTESLVTSHAKEEVGCIQCHGKSVAHQIDEFHRTPPEKMYGPHNVDKMCGECHEEHDAPARKVIERWQQRCPAKTNLKEIVCTDCHFEHRLPKRTVVWDKKTGKLVIHKKTQAANSGKSK